MSATSHPHTTSLSKVRLSNDIVVPIDADYITLITRCSKTAQVDMLVSTLTPPPGRQLVILPTELWLLILDIVIGEGIVRMDHCDHTMFPYIQDLSISSRSTRSRSYASYRRLRLVCRHFKTILGDSPSHTLAALSVFPLATTTRALVLDLDPLPATQIQRLLTDTSTCDRLVSLDVTCGVLCPDLTRAPLFDFLRASAEGAFPSVQRLTIRILNKPYNHHKIAFWGPLHRAFPLLVTLAITTDCTYKHRISLGGENDVVTFENLEILYLDSGVMYSGCHFPRLKHASLPIGPSELEMVARSPHLESLLVPGLPFPPHSFDLGRFPDLKLLGFREGFEYLLASMYWDHPLEHLWLFGVNAKGDYRPIQAVMDRFPQISRLTVDLSAVTWRRERLSEEVRQMRLASINLSSKPPRYEGDPILDMERTTVHSNGGVLERFRMKIRL